MKNILITGGAGFIGSNLAEALLIEGYFVKIIDNLSTGKVENVSPFRNHIEFIEGDIRDENLVVKLMTGTDAVFHLAAISSIYHAFKYPSDTVDVNVNGTMNLLEKAARSGVEKFIFASSAAAYGKIEDIPLSESYNPAPFSLYGISKVMGEDFLHLFYEHFGLKTVALRFFNVFGPKQNPQSEYSAVIPKFISLYLQDKRPVIFGDGLQTRDFIFIKDLIRAIIVAATTEIDMYGDCFNLGCGREISIYELFETIGDILNKKVQPNYEPLKTEETRRSCASIKKAEETFGFKPQYSLKKGLKETINKYCSF